MLVSALYKIPGQRCCTTELLISSSEHSEHKFSVQWSFMIVHTWVESAGISLAMPFYALSMECALIVWCRRVCTDYLHTLMVKSCLAPNPTKICHSLAYCISPRWQKRMQQWTYCKWKENTTVSDDGKPKCSEEHLFQHGYVHHKPHTASSGTEPRSPWWEASE